jgi:1-deoxy-D-xylulose-5-phosphate reductoisomerase
MHALVTYQDGSMLAQLSKPNMQIPISYALYYPDRAFLEDFNQINMFEIASLNFYEPDKEKFISLKILDSVLSSIDGNSALVFNIANEEAVTAFLNDKITFSQITNVIEEVLSQVSFKKLNSINEIFEHIELVKQKTLAYINKISLL